LPFFNGYWYWRFYCQFIGKLYPIDEDAVYRATIFFMAGIGLFIGFNMTKNLDKE